MLLYKHFSDCRFSFAALAFGQNAKNPTYWTLSFLHAFGHGIRDFGDAGCNGHTHTQSTWLSHMAHMAQQMHILYWQSLDEFLVRLLVYSRFIFSPLKNQKLLAPPYFALVSTRLLRLHKIFALLIFGIFDAFSFLGKRLNHNRPSHQLTLYYRLLHMVFNMLKIIYDNRNLMLWVHDGFMMGLWWVPDGFMYGALNLACLALAQKWTVILSFLTKLLTATLKPSRLFLASHKFAQCFQVDTCHLQIVWSSECRA